MEKIMAVLAAEESYARRLCAYANLCSLTSLIAVPFASVEAYLQFGRKSNVQVLLADADMLRAAQEEGIQGGELLHAVRLIGLSEEESGQPGRSEQALLAADAVIYKYQAADALLRAVMQCCGDLRIGAVVPRMADAQVIGIYSPVGRCHKTAFALTLARVLAAKKRTLYLNFEAFSGFSALTGAAYSSSLSDALYHLKQRSLNEQVICSLIHTFSGISYIPPVQIADDMQGFGSELYAELIETILQESDFQAIVADFSAVCVPSGALLNLCSEFYVPRLEDADSRARLSEFDAYIARAGNAALQNKLISVHIPKPDVTVYGEGYVDRLLFGPVGDFVRDLYGYKAA